jgi:hypothetical protein
MSATSKGTLLVIQRDVIGDNAIYQLIVSAASSADLTAKRAPDVWATTVSSFIEDLRAASVVVADVSDVTDSVMFSVGSAAARGKPVIIVALRSRDVPISLVQYRLVIYEASSPEDFVSRLSGAIKDALRQPEQFRGERLDRELKENVFVSYSHNDVEYLDRLLVHLKPLENAGLLELWADTRLKAGDKWKMEIEDALERQSAVVHQSPAKLGFMFCA